MTVALKPARIVDLYRQYFEWVPADTESLRLEAYKLRYQIYCLEEGFESVEKCPVVADGTGRKVPIETDAFDDRAVHYLIRHRNSGCYVATTRLILPQKDAPGTLLPLEIHYPKARRFIDPVQRCQVAEVSRYGISSEFLRQTGEMRRGALDAPTALGLSVTGRLQERKVLPYLGMALVGGLVHLSRRHHIVYWYAAMEPALFRLNQRFGIVFEILGEGTHYHGWRVPGRLCVDEMLEKVKQVDFSVWELITQDGLYG